MIFRRNECRWNVKVNDLQKTKVYYLTLKRPARFCSDAHIAQRPVYLVRPQGSHRLSFDFGRVGLRAEVLGKEPFQQVIFKIPMKLSLSPFVTAAASLACMLSSTALKIESVTLLKSCQLGYVTWRFPRKGVKRHMNSIDQKQNLSAEDVDRCWCFLLLRMKMEERSKNKRKKERLPDSSFRCTKPSIVWFRSK